MAPNSKTKRKRDRDDDDDDESGKAIWADLGLDPDDLHLVLGLDKSRLATLLAHIAIQADIKTTSFKKARTDLLASFSSTTWADLTEHPSLNLHRQFRKQDFGQLELRKCRLPPSFFKPLLATAWRFIDVYQEPGDQTREAARLRIFDPLVIPVLACFHGRIVDKPEDEMPATKVSSGGEVEHAIYLYGEVLFLVLEFKQELNTGANHAQLFTAVELNVDRAGVYKDFPVYGLLTDLARFEFWSYDPNLGKFFRVGEVKAALDTRDGLLQGMMKATNTIFSILLTSYLDSLALKRRSSNPSSATSSPVQDEASPRRSSASQMQDSPSTPTTRKILEPTVDWKGALEIARECYAKFDEPAGSEEALEAQSTEALELLTKSVLMIPRAYDSDSGDLTSARQIEERVDGVIKSVYVFPSPGGEGRSAT